MSRSVHVASVDVAVTDNVKSAETVAVIVRPTRSAADTVQLPLPLLTPALSVAPAGMPEMRIDNVSEPSRSVSADEISRPTVTVPDPEAPKRPSPRKPASSPVGVICVPTTVSEGVSPMAAIVTLTRWTEDAPPASVTVTSKKSAPL